MLGIIYSFCQDNWKTASQSYQQMIMAALKWMRSLIYPTLQIFSSSIMDICDRPSKHAEVNNLTGFYSISVRKCVVTAAHVILANKLSW